MLSQAVEDYIKAIYQLQDASTVSTSKLAARLGVSSASVTSMAKRLAGMGLVTYESYRGVALTGAGEKIALEIIRHHRLLETYLREIMGYGWEEMHNEAEHLEHHISEEFEDRLDEMLGYPTHDPHGDPIPSREGTIEIVEADPLTDAPTDTELQVMRLRDTDTDILDFLESVGVLPGTRLTLLDEPGDTIRVRVGRRDHTIESRIAEHVYVARPPR